MNIQDRRQWTRWVAYIAVFALVAAACADDEEPATTAAAPTTTAAAPATTEAPGTTEAPMEEPEELRPVPTLRIITKTAAEGPPRYEQARLIAESWTAGGIPAEIEPVESSELGRRGFSVKDFDVYIIIYDPTTDRWIRRTSWPGSPPPRRLKTVPIYPVIPTPPMTSFTKLR